MLKALHIINRVKISSRLNSLLYFIKKLPILKRKLRTTNYSFLKLKGAIGIISIPYNIVSTFLKGFLVFFTTMYLPSNFLAKEKAAIALPTLIFFFYFVLRLVSSYMLEFDLNKFIMVKQMRMNAREYSLATIFPEEILKLITKVIIFILFLEFGTFKMYGITLAISIFSFAMFTEAIHLYLFDKFDFTIYKHNVLLVILYLMIVFVGYILAFGSSIEIFFMILTSPVFFIVTIILGIWGSIYILKYKDYYRVINKTNNIEFLDNQKELTKDIYFNEVKIKEKDFSDEDLRIDKFTKKEGYSYLNAIFFDRHKKMVYKPMMIKSIFIAVLFIIAALVTELLHKEVGPIIGRFSYESFNMFVFLMYVLCNSQRLIKSMFYNCDLSLLRYGFYRRGDALLRMFFLRLLRIIYSNLVPTTVLVLGLGYNILKYTEMGFSDLIPIVLLLYALAMFFSVHYIFMYYIFQPFTSSLEVKSPFYSFINFLVYFISYMLIQVPAPSIVFLPMVIGFLLVYTAIAVILVYKKAPRTFRIK